MLKLEEQLRVRLHELLLMLLLLMMMEQQMVEDVVMRISYADEEQKEEEEVEVEEGVEGVLLRLHEGVNVEQQEDSFLHLNTD